MWHRLRRHRLSRHSRHRLSKNTFSRTLFAFNNFKHSTNYALDRLIHKFQSKKAAIKCKSSCFPGRHLPGTEFYEYWRENTPSYDAILECTRKFFRYKVPCALQDGVIAHKKISDVFLQPKHIGVSLLVWYVFCVPGKCHGVSMTCTSREIWGHVVLSWSY
jgi:hypothetical protein